jgi:hypothetical protein
VVRVLGNLLGTTTKLVNTVVTTTVVYDVMVFRNPPQRPTGDPPRELSQQWRLLVSGVRREGWLVGGFN